MVRAKFKCEAVEGTSDDGSVATIRLSPVHSGSAENEQFFKWTPSGQISIGTVNAAAAKQFEVGKEYYVDFTPAA